MTSSLLLVRLGALGDVVHAMPVVAAVRAAWPACRIGWLVHQRYAALVSRVRGVDAVYPVRRALDVATIGAVRAARYEVCLDLQGLMKSAAYARASGARRVIGFSRDLVRESVASLAYGETGGAPGLHVVQQNLSLLRRIGIEAGPPQIDLDVPESPAVAGVYELLVRAAIGGDSSRVAEGEHSIAEDKQIAGDSHIAGADQPPPRLRRSAEASAKAEAPALHAAALQALARPSTVYRLPSTVQRAQSGHHKGEVAPPSPSRGSPAREASTTTEDGARKTEGEADRPRFVLLNPGAGWPNKQWPAERFGQLAARLRDEADLPSVVLWGPGEASLAAAVVRSSGGAAVMAPQSGLDEVLAIAQAATVVVAGDTGPLHLAAAVGTPVVGLFGPTPPERNGPWHPADLVVSRHEQCHCVFKRACTSTTWCLGQIEVDEVAKSVEARVLA